MFKFIVLSCLVACSAAEYFAYPFAYSAFGAYPYAYDGNYRGPLSLAPGQPANILGADGRPLDTLEVNLDKSAHFTRKAFENAGIHLIKKRSAPLAAPLAYGTVPYSAFPYSYGAYPYAYGAYPYSYGAYPYSFNGNYRGPLSLAPGQPANILGADGRPLDTLEVNLDKSVHFTKKAFESAGVHLIKKRSAPLASFAALPAAPLLHAAPVTYSAPLTYSTPIATTYTYSPFSYYGSRYVY